MTGMNTLPASSLAQSWPEAPLSRAPRVAYATPYDASDIGNWSGTGYYIAEAMKRQGAEVVNVWPRDPVVGIPDRLKRLFYQRIIGSNHQVMFSRGTFKRQARQVQLQLRPDADVIVSTGVAPVAYLRTELPIVTWADATFRVMRDYYSAFRNMSWSSARAIDDAEKWVARRADALVFSSRWAADSAVADYGADPAKVRVISYGANVPAELTESEAQHLIDSRPRERCRLLFVGAEWERKGGSIAVKTATLLEGMGLKTEVIVLGCEPPKKPLANVTVLGFVSKKTPEGRARIESLFRSSHFLILPTRADCTPIVMCEAASFALPVVSTNTGGVPSLVHDHVTGLLLALEAPPEDYAAGIATILRDRDRYCRMARAAFREYQSRLNWNTAGGLMMEVISEVASRRRERRPGPARTDNVDPHPSV